MLKAFLRSSGAAVAALFCVLFLAGISFAQTNTVEGTYTITSQSNELGTFNFLLVLKRSGEKWIGEFKDMPTPLTITTVTIDESKITIVADASGTPVTISGKIDGLKMG